MRFGQYVVGNNPFRQSIVWAVLALASSVGTLLCCALPSLLVTVGMGAVLAGVVTAMPELVIISQYKAPIFIGAGVCLSLAGYAKWHTRYAACPVDPQQARACQMLRRISRAVLITAIGIYAIGGFFAFAASGLLL